MHSRKMLIQRKTVWAVALLLCMGASVHADDPTELYELTSPATAGTGHHNAHGNAVSGVGDVNSDGFPDIAVSSYGEDVGTEVDAGVVRVYSGKDGALLYTFNGGAAGDQLGFSVSGAGDVNLDGYADIIAGASRASTVNGTNSGSALVFSGKDGSVLYTFLGDSAGDIFGYSVSGAGDVNADGFPDLIVGAIQDDNNGAASGTARVFSGKDGSILYTFAGDATQNILGHSVSGAGDVNQDGFDDVIAGAPGGAAFARVYSGKDGSTLYTFNPNSLGAFFGYAVAGVGDVNGDAFPDVVVTAIGAGLESGGARVFSGKDGSVLHTFLGDSAGDAFGFSASGVGDINADGCADLMVGATQDDTNGNNTGSVRVFSGKDGSILCTIDGPAPPGLNFGYFVDGVGDVNQDGFPDIVIGSNNRGVHVYSLVDVPALVTTLIDEVFDINLASGIANNLDAKLDTAMDALLDTVDGNDGAATNMLQAFINAVSAQAGKKISEADADALIAAALDIIYLLEAS